MAFVLYQNGPDRLWQLPDRSRYIMERKRIEFLYNQYLANKATPAELEEWAVVLEDEKAKAILDVVIDASYYLIPDRDLIEMDANRPEEIFNHIISHKVAETSGTRETAVTRFLWPKILAAASVAAILILSGLIFYKYRNNDKQGLAYAASQILPGKQGASLTLSNGKRIKLNEAKYGMLASQAGVRISKTSKGEIQYEIDHQNDASPNALNTLSTAVGETYSVILPDKSKVWLNAASSIKYPASFSGSAKREIQLDGEAYFEIAKDKSHPFVVKTVHQEVEVLGTHFNINSYREDHFEKTTLLEGSVLVRRKSDPATTESKVILKPNQQSLFTGTGFKIEDVETSDAIAWKNGYFMFNNEEFGQIMQTLSRWYNTTVVYEDESMKHELVFAKLSRYENISKILLLLEKTGKVKFTVSGNTITISRKLKD